VSRRRIKKKAAPPARRTIEPGPLGQKPFLVLKDFKPQEKTPTIPEPSPEKPPAGVDDEFLFESAMSEVEPIHWKNQRVARRFPRRDRFLNDRLYSEDLEVLAHLEDLVAGRARFDIVDTDEYLEGFIQGLRPIILERLRRGHFSVQAYLDLHGLTVREAEAAVHEFIAESIVLGYRCVLLVHGRGLNSKDQIPVLKRQLQTILLRGRARKHILAFTSARPHDGGAGASYVLLRARK